MVYGLIGTSAVLALLYVIAGKYINYMFDKYQTINITFFRIRSIIAYIISLIFWLIIFNYDDKVVSILSIGISVYWSYQFLDNKDEYSYWKEQLEDDEDDYKE
ncbi:MAG: hypothetical protein ACI4UE_06365 [Candidatus Scatovivens sp.]